MGHHHEIAATRRNLHGVFDCSLPPVLSIDVGDTVTLETLEVGWRTSRVLGDGTARRLEPRDSELDNGPALTGPVAIKGAKPGMIVEISIIEIVLGDWGWNSAPAWTRPELNESLRVSERLGLYWDIDKGAGLARNQWGHEVALRPFPGTLGIAPAGPRVDGWTPRSVTAGNLDLNLLTEGARLCLPVAVDGALVSVGDVHATQGDGEVGGTAIECPARITLGFDLLPAEGRESPWLESQGIVATFGVGETLDEAMIVALNSMLDLIVRESNLSRERALALASTQVDLRITQVVNPKRGVHAVISREFLNKL